MAASTQTESGFKDPVYESAVEAASLLSAAADPNRMTILTILAAEGTACVCVIQEHVPVAANLLSYHLKVLRDAGLVVGRRRGRWVDYELAGDALCRLRATIPPVPDDGGSEGERASVHNCAVMGRSSVKGRTRASPARSQHRKREA